MMQGDLNGDGRLAANELQGPAAQRMLQNGDQNQDGALDRNEIAAALEAMQNQFGPGATGPNPGGRRPGADQGGFRGGAGGNFDAQQMTGRMMQFDENGDGKLSPNEVPREAKRFLNNADQDGDGLLSPSELQAVNERMGEQMRGAQGRGLRGRAVQNGAERGVP
jgi:Ca2+-binding EF-hand superfamily protein